MLEPTLDNTTGALFIGYSIGTVLYGIGCLQMFIYMTSERAKEDGFSFKLYLGCVCIIETANQIVFAAMMYFDLIKTQGNNPTEAANMIQILTSVAIATAGGLVFLVQIFFCWRVYRLSVITLGKKYRVTLLILMILLAVFGIVSAICVAGFFNALSLQSANKNMIITFEMQMASATALDTIIAVAMTWSLLHSRSGSKRTDHAIKFLVFFTINTNLLTAVTQWVELIAVLVFPQTQIYSIFGFLVPRLYLNSLLATLNSRQFIKDQINRDISRLSFSRVRFGKSPSNTTKHQSQEISVSASNNEIFPVQGKIQNNNL